MRSNEPGFSIGEVMMAITVLLVGVLASLELLNAGVRGASDSRKVIIASALAQEGAEMFRNGRDNDWVQNIGAAQQNIRKRAGFNWFNAGEVHCRYAVNWTRTNGQAQGVDLSDNSVCDNNFTANNYRLGWRPAAYQYMIHALGGGNIDSGFSRYIHVDNVTITPEALPFPEGYSMDYTVFVYWGPTVPSGINSGTTTNCTVVNRCVYTRSQLRNWIKP